MIRAACYALLVGTDGQPIVAPVLFLFSLGGADPAEPAATPTPSPTHLKGQVA